MGLVELLREIKPEALNVFTEALALTVFRLDASGAVTSAEFLEELENTAIEISADPDDPADVREVGILVLIVRARLQVGKEWAENPNEWMTPFLKDYDSIGEQIDEIFNEDTD